MQATNKDIVITYTVLKNQSIVDIAIQFYGNVDAVQELLQLNPSIFGGGSDRFSMEMPEEYDMGMAVAEGTVLNYDETSSLCNILAIEARKGEALCTAADNEVLVELPPLPPPPPPPPYVFHADTLVFLEDRVNDVPGAPWIDHITMDEAIILDRLVRDLHGESNPDYNTEDIWAKLTVLYPMMGNEAEMHRISLMPDAPIRMSFSGSVVHAANKFSTNGSNSYADTGIAESDIDKEDICIGFVMSNYIHSALYPPFYPEYFMGTSSPGHGLWVRNWNGIYDSMITMPNTFGSVTNAQANEYLHLEGNSSSQRLYLGATHTQIAQRAYVADTAGTSNILIGKINTSYSIIAEFNLAYIGISLSDSERKSLMNSINYFLYCKGVRGSFTAII